MAQLSLVNPIGALYNPHSLKNGAAATKVVQFNTVLSFIP